MTFELTSHAISDVGKVRSRNEDAYLVDKEYGLYVVADGMGGHAGGDEASRMAVEGIATLLKDGNADGADAARNEIETRLINAVKAANQQIIRRSQTDDAVRGMGTTVTALLVRDNTATIGHVGDSRAYILRGGQFSQITEDHSWVNEQLKAGLIKPTEAKTHPFKNVITRSLGHEPDLYVDVMSLEMESGDIYFLCSDGLTNLVEDAEIKSALESQAPEAALQSLVDLANSRGGHDNITMVLLSVGGNSS